MTGSPHEQALIASRWLRSGDDRLWADFPRYWMAFNALYNAVRGEGDSEVTAVMKVIRAFFDSSRAIACLNEVDDQCIARLIAIPPGDDRRSPNDSDYRAKTTLWVYRFQHDSDSVERLACLMAVVYQVRCNLLHGSKDPTVLRDQELVASCTPILNVVVAHLENIMQEHHSVPMRASDLKLKPASLE